MKNRERIEGRELSEGRVTASRALEAQPGLLDDVVELGQDSRRAPLGLIEIRGLERPREDPGGSWHRSTTPSTLNAISSRDQGVMVRDRKFADSLLEGDGFEPS